MLSLLFVAVAVVILVLGLLGAIVLTVNLVAIAVLLLCAAMVFSSPVIVKRVP